MAVVPPGRKSSSSSPRVAPVSDLAGALLFAPLGGGFSNPGEKVAGLDEYNFK